MNANGVNVLDLETSSLELVDNPAKRSGSVSTGEDVLVHEKTPGEVLVLPSLSETSILKEEGTIVVEHVVDLVQEGGEVTDTDVLGHLKTGDSLVAALGDRNVAVVHAQDLALLLRNSNLAHSSVTPSSLVAAQSDTSGAGPVVLAGETGKGSPTTTNIEHGVTLLEANLLANDSHLVILELLKGLFLVDVRNDT